MAETLQKSREGNLSCPFSKEMEGSVEKQTEVEGYEISAPIPEEAKKLYRESRKRRMDKVVSETGSPSYRPGWRSSMKQADRKILEEVEELIEKIGLEPENTGTWNVEEILNRDDRPPYFQLQDGEIEIDISVTALYFDTP